MGRRYTAICKNCETMFEVREGGGLSFYLLHCNKCGKEKVIPEAEIRNYLLENSAKLKGLSYQEKVSEYAGKCSDGGQFSLKAKPRCPKCLSDQYKMAPNSTIDHYD